MRVKKIGALCKARGICYLYDEVDEDGEIRRQWITNGAAMWPVSGLPMLRESNLSTLFDFQGKTVEKMLIKEAIMPEWLAGVLQDYESWENELQESSLRILSDGKEWTALDSDGKTTWIDAALLGPCWTTQTRLVRRETERTEVVAVLDGLLLSGILLPMPPKEDFFRELLRLGVSARKPVARSEDEEEKNKDGDEDP